MDKHDDIAGADDGLYDVCLFMPRAFIGLLAEACLAEPLNTASFVASACDLLRKKDELVGNYSYKIGFHGRFRGVADGDFLKRCLIELRESFAPQRFASRELKFFEDRAVSSGKVASLKFKATSTLQSTVCVLTIEACA